MARNHKSSHLIHFAERINKTADSIRQDMISLRKDLSSLAHISAKQQAILEEHIRRTEINEEALKATNARLVPIEAHVQMWSGVGKALAILAALGGIITCSIAIIKFLVLKS